MPGIVYLHQNQQLKDKL